MTLLEGIRCVEIALYAFVDEAMQQELGLDRIIDLKVAGILL